MASRLLYLVRHGQYDATDGPAGDCGLTLLGRQQAALTGQALRDMRFDAIYASSMRRATETAEIIAKSFLNLPIQITDDLREVIPVIPLRFAELFATQLPQVTAETTAHDREQADRAFDQFFNAAPDGDSPGAQDHFFSTSPPTQKETRELIVCHGNLIQYLMCRVMEAPIENWLQFDTNHCGITRVLVDSLPIRKLLSFNDIGHLPPDMHTIC